MIIADTILKRTTVALGIYAACIAAAQITELLGAIPGSGVSIWLPAGVLLAAALASPRPLWPLWAAASIAAEYTGNLIWYHHSFGPASLLAIGNAIASLTGAFIIRKFIPAGPILVTIKGAAIFMVVAAICMPLLSASTGSIALGWSYDRPWNDAWFRILLGDATGATLAAPLSLLLFRTAAPALRMHPRRWIEASSLLIFFVIMAGIAFGGVMPFAFLLIPPLLWAALSFRIPGAIYTIVAVSLVSILFTLVGMGPFAQNLIYADIENEALQMFLIIASTTALLMGAIAEENRTGIKRLNSANRTLEERVAERSASLVQSETKARETANLLSAISEACPDLIYAKDLGFNIIYANTATLKAMGADRIEDFHTLTEKAFYKADDEFDAVRKNDIHVLATTKTLVVEETITSPDGERRIYRTTKAPLYDAEGSIAGIAGVSVDISDIKKAQARENMLVREVEHRARNLLAVVQGVVQLAHADTVSDLKAKLSKRIRALAQTNGAIAASDWRGASLKNILEDELAPYRSDMRSNILVTGEDVMLAPSIAQSMTLVVHELTTNAAKYGCLSNETGRLSVEWKIDQRPPATPLLNMTWHESGGPPVSAPTHKGFGTTMISVFGQEHPDSKVDFCWETTGLIVRLSAPLTGYVDPERKAETNADGSPPS
ncbi:MAG: MASE1 domain-containing protein [Sphingomonadaceae bacterium]|nr:MASE1 domain-containing protein [Sphingomonadaceae bacterium]